VKARFRYDAAYDPPAPIVPLLVSVPGGGRQIATTALLDTGADCTLLPTGIVRALALPQVDWLRIETVGGPAVRASVHAAELGAGPWRALARVVGFGYESLLGRDWLNRLHVILDGPALTLFLQARSRTSARR
jgi:predicted aspartyl protease